MKTGANRIMMGVLSALVAGCCTLNQPDDPCRYGEATVFVGPGQLHVRPECVAVEAGESITLNLRRAEGVRGVQTRPAAANKDATWLGAASNERDAIVLNVPPDTPEGEYKYEIVVNGVGKLDPRVRVK